jgi:hypothetical protein
MKTSALPETWTAGRSSAVLMMLSSALAGGKTSKERIQHTQWELEKYGPAFHEPPSNILIEDGARFWRLQADTVDESDPRALGRFHGSEILRRRGRQALDATTAACARIAACGEAPGKVISMLEDVVRHSTGVMSLVEAGCEYHVGRDDDIELHANSTTLWPSPRGGDRGGRGPRGPDPVRFSLHVDDGGPYIAMSATEIGPDT